MKFNKNLNKYPLIIEFDIKQNHLSKTYNL